MTQSLDALVARIKVLEERLNRANRTPQLRRSSLENGAIREYDDTGQLVAQYGSQFDGTHGAVVLAGPNPPVPSEPTLATELRGVTLSWDGTFVDAVAPMDFRYVRGEVSDTADFTGTVRAAPAITSADGGRVFVPWGPAGTPLYARLQTWSQAGKFSGYSDTTGPAASGQVGIGDLGFNLDDYVSGSRIFYGASTPTATAIGDLWLKEVAAGPPPRYETWRWDGTTWVILQDQGVTQALVDAATAQTAADSKARVFNQTTAPAWTGADGSAVWYDTDAGNAMYVWGTSTTAYRQNLAVNPSFEADAAGTVTAVTGWTNFANGSLGTVTRSIVTTGGVADRSKAARAVSSSMAATAAVGVGYQQTVAAVPGDVLRVQAVFTVAVTGANFVPYVQVEWLNVGGTVISTPSPTSGSGTVTTAQTLTWSGTAPALAVSARITLMRRTAATTGSALASASITIDAVLVEKNRVANAATIYFDGASGGETAWDGTADASTSHTYQEGTSGAQGWQPRRLRTGSFEPNALVASDVIATGTVSAALLEALMVLANVVITGDPNGDHARLDAGLRIFALTPDGDQVEAGSFGTTGADKFTIVDPATGNTLLTVNVTGMTTPLLSTDSLIVGGNNLDYLLDQRGGHCLATGTSTASTPSTSTSRGYFDVEFLAVPGRRYRIHTTPLQLTTSSTATYAFAQLRIRPSADGAPSVSTGIPMATYNGSTNLVGGVEPCVLDRSINFDQMFTGTPPTVPTLMRVLVCYGVNSGGGTAAIFSNGSFPIQLDVDDAGPARQPLLNNNDGLGTTSVAVTTRVSRWASTWAANWQQFSTGPRTGLADLAQGYSPSTSSLGSQVGQFGFGDGFDQANGANVGTIAAATAASTINSMRLYIYAKHWYYVAGGIGLLGAHPYLNPPATRPADWQLNLMQIPNWQRGAGKWITIPSTWWAGFISGANRGFTLGDLASTFGDYYGRFAGDPSDSARPVLEVNYTK